MRNKEPGRGDCDGIPGAWSLDQNQDRGSRNGPHQVWRRIAWHPRALAFSPETTKPLCELVEVLLCGPQTLTPAEREMIAAYVSSQNDCHYCHSCHGATAEEHLGGRPADYDLVGQVKRNYTAAPISHKMKALLAITGKVQKGRQTRYSRRCCRCPLLRRDRQRDSRHGTDRGRLLRVQSLRRRFGHLAARGSGNLSRDWEANCTLGLRGPRLETATPDTDNQIAPPVPDLRVRMRVTSSQPTACWWESDYLPLEDEASTALWVR